MLSAPGYISQKHLRDKPHLCSNLSEWNQLTKHEVSQRFIPGLSFDVSPFSSLINFVQQIRDLQYDSVCKFVASWHIKPHAVPLFY